MTKPEGSNTPKEKDIKKSSFSKELYRRDLFKVCLVYLLIGLIAWKSTILLTPVFDLPEQTSRVTGIFLVLLFPFAIVMAWVYEMAPDGFIKIDTEEAMKNPYGREKRKPLTNKFFILFLVIVLVLLYAIFPG